MSDPMYFPSDEYPGHQPELPFRSNLLRSFFSQLDEEVAHVEGRARHWQQEAETLQRELSLKQHEELQAGQRMIGDALGSLFGTPSVSSITPAAAIAFSRIRHMKSLEEIHAFIDELGEKVVTELK